MNTDDLVTMPTGRRLPFEIKLHIKSEVHSHASSLSSVMFITKKKYKIKQLKYLGNAKLYLCDQWNITQGQLGFISFFEIR